MKWFDFAHHKRFTILLGLAVLFLAPVVGADVPQLINFQGVLRDGNGDPVVGTTGVTFTIYTAATNGSVLWAETTSVTSDGSGLFSVLLGADNPVPDSVFNDTTAYLGIKVGGDPEMIPRQRLVTVGYSFAFSGWTVSDSNLILADRLGGSVGIGETNPIAKLDVEGDIHASGPISSGSTVTIDGATGTITSSGTANRLLVLNADTVRINGKATIGPGHTNTGLYAFVAGNSNTVSGDFSAVAGGAGNTASGIHAVIGGGLANVANGDDATISGGASNRANNTYSTVSGGYTNTASGHSATVSGGYADTASEYFATVGGGFFNIAGDTGATVGGGSHNKARGIFSTIGGGGGSLLADSNSASGDWATVSGGLRNSAGSGIATVVGGGEHNSANGGWATVSGGLNNTANNYYATVGGGVGDTAGGTFATVSGGFYNNAGGVFAAIGGGATNRAGDTAAAIGGGEANIASGRWATVGGGQFDTAGGRFSTVPGGFANKASGNYSFAAGRRAKAVHNSAFVWADAGPLDFASTDTNQFLIRASGGVGIGTNSPANQLDVEGRVAIGAAYSGTNIAPTNGLIVQGNVGIGTPLPAVRLHVSGTESRLRLQSSSSTGFTVTEYLTDTREWHSGVGGSAAGGGVATKYYVWYGNGVNQFRLVIDTLGNVGLGTTSPLDVLQVVGNIRVGTSGTNGCLKRFDGVSLVGTCASDLRLKKDVRPFSPLLEKLSRLQPVNFKWRTEEYPDLKLPKVEDRGLIAQEVEKVLPELVTEDEKGFKAIHYHELPLMLLQAVKELKEENDELKDRILKLEQGKPQAKGE